MNAEQIRVFCLSLPHATEDVQWESLLFRVGRKMFAIMPLEGGREHCLSFKTSQEKAAELVENEDIDPAPYLARYHWVALRRFDAIPARELKDLLRESYELVKAGLPKRLRPN